MYEVILTLVILTGLSSGGTFDVRIPLEGGGIQSVCEAYAAEQLTPHAAVDLNIKMQQGGAKDLVAPLKARCVRLEVA